ncbi:MAG: hypothetical protein Q8Q33_05725, partial [Chlamydiota bacterium]|nr:hypothetical protein [Chlamydiota bacterium]
NADLKGVNGMDESNFKGLYSRKIIKEFTSGLRRIQIQIFRWNEKDPQSTPQMILDTWVQTNGSR